MKRFVSVLAVSAALGAVAADSDYTAETGYVTLTSNDDRDKSSFYSVGRWSDGQDPHSGTNYYVGSQLQFYCDNNRTDDFAGDGIWVAGKVYHPGGWVNNVNCGPLHMLPGSWLTWRGVGGFANGSMEILGSEANPVTIRFSTPPQSQSVRMPSRCLFRPRPTRIFGLPILRAPSRLTASGSWSSRTRMSSARHSRSSRPGRTSTARRRSTGGIRWHRTAACFRRPVRSCSIPSPSCH